MKKWKRPWQQYFAIGCFMVIGFLCGIGMALEVDKSLPLDAPLLFTVGSYAVMVVLICLSVVTEMLVHESGHLVFGLLTGYRFSSFRIFSHMWLKEGDKIRKKKLTIAGTGGQCLMAPPDLKNGTFPVVLYNLGGSLMNLMAAVLFILLYLWIPHIPYLSAFFLFNALIGIAFGIINGVPLRMGVVDNDGYNAFSLKKNPDALRAFWIQMKINEANANGTRLKDMPAEWFETPDYEGMQNALISAIGVFGCNRLMDEHRFMEADQKMAELLSMKSAMVNLYRGMLTMDRVYVELIGDARKEVIDSLFTKEIKAMMKPMKDFPSVIRTQYAYELLYEENPDRAQKVRVKFEKAASVYPYDSDIRSERELIQIADEKAEERREARMKEAEERKLQEENLPAGE